MKIFGIMAMHSLYNCDLVKTIVRSVTFKSSIRVLESIIEIDSVLDSTKQIDITFTCSSHSNVVKKNARIFRSTIFRNLSFFGLKL